MRKWGQWIKEQAEKELSEFYPKDPDGSTPVAYLWARTITCEGPGCGAEVPLVRSLLLLAKSDRRWRRNWWRAKPQNVWNSRSSSNVMAMVKPGRSATHYCDSQLRWNHQTWFCNMPLLRIYDASGTNPRTT